MMKLMCTSRAGGRAGAASALLALLGAGCTVARPFSGPERGAAAPRAGKETVTLVLTHAVLERSRRGPFDAYTKRIVAALDSGRVDGLVGFSVRKELLGDEVWTMTVWADRDASMRFAATSPHREAMEEAASAMRSFRVRALEVPPDAIPPRWDEALRWLDAPENGAGGTR